MPVIWNRLGSWQRLARKTETFLLGPDPIQPAEQPEPIRTSQWERVPSCAQNCTAHTSMQARAATMQRRAVTMQRRAVRSATAAAPPPQRCSCSRRCSAINTIIAWRQRRAARMVTYPRTCSPSMVVLRQACLLPTRLCAQPCRPMCLGSLPFNRNVAHMTTPVRPRSIGAETCVLKGTGRCRHCRVLAPSQCPPAGSRCPARLCQPNPNPALTCRHRVAAIAA
jgi:hypothetical protein